MSDRAQGVDLNAACTIVSPNYLPYARTLAASYMAFHPGQRFFVLVVADLSDRYLLGPEPFEIVMLPEIGLGDIRQEAMKYDILELNTNVKPTLLRYLLERQGLDQVIYLDPDIYIYRNLGLVFDALDNGATGVLTPHLTSPITDDLLPSEQDILYNGTYNLGFFAVRRCAEGLRLLRWWEERCLQLGYSEGRTGLFVDQKWMNLAPGLFEGITILRDAGCNMAYWNLPERKLEKDSDGYNVRSDGSAETPLSFFHFSGVVVDDAEMLSKNTNRFTLADRPDLWELFADYKAKVQANRRDTVDALPYGFDRLSDGTVVTRLARRIYGKHARWPGQDPFDATGDFARFAKRLGLVAGKQTAAKSTWKEFNPRDRRVELVHRVLKTALRVLGPNRYELLMRYLGHITVLRNQSVFLDD